ncbi:MAG: DMT family transporter [bacterium]|nr:DMT family transporter [bacterium]
MKMRQIKWKNTIMLLLAAFIWGNAFVAQSVGMNYIGPFTFSSVRSIIGGIVLLPVIAVFGQKKQLQNGSDRTVQKEDKRTLLIAGCACGVILFIATNAQQIALQYTSVGKAGFLTALYIVIVPVLGIFIKRRCGCNVWVAVAIAVAGFYLLCMKEGFSSLTQGDLYLIVCAVVFSLHILVVDHFSPFVDGVKLSCIQFFVCGILSGIVMLLVERPAVSSILAAWMPILYAGALSCGVGYTFQILGQKDYNPTVASLLMSLESVFSALAGWVLLKQALSMRELFGCLLIFAAIILAQLPERKAG